MRSATISTMSGMEERVLIEGDLQKLGRRFKRWHQRYFRIKGSHMYYYKKPVSTIIYNYYPAYIYRLSTHFNASITSKFTSYSHCRTPNVSAKSIWVT